MTSVEEGRLCLIFLSYGIIDGGNNFVKMYRGRLLVII